MQLRRDLLPERLRGHDLHVLTERITGLAGVPTLWSLLVQPSSTLNKHAFPDLRYITNTGGAMPQAVLRVLREVLPRTKVFLMYGLTEAFRSTFLPPEELDRRPTSMGKAIPDTEILVLNEQGQLCKPGEPGELVAARHCVGPRLVTRRRAALEHLGQVVPPAAGARPGLLLGHGRRVAQPCGQQNGAVA